MIFYNVYAKITSIVSAELPQFTLEQCRTCPSGIAPRLGRLASQAMPARTWFAQDYEGELTFTAEAITTFHYREKWAHDPRFDVRAVADRINQGNSLRLSDVNHLEDAWAARLDAVTELNNDPRMLVIATEQQPELMKIHVGRAITMAEDLGEMDLWAAVAGPQDLYSSSTGEVSLPSVAELHELGQGPVLLARQALEACPGPQQKTQKSLFRTTSTTFCPQV